MYLETSFERETADAASALLALRSAPGVDPARMTIVGHSVGATIAVRLAARYEWLAGVVLLAAATTPRVEVMRIQSERIAGSLRGLQRLGARRFLRRRFAGSTPDDLTHVLRKDSGPPSLARYPAQLRRPVDDDLLDVVSEWVSGRQPRP